MRPRAAWLAATACGLALLAPAAALADPLPDCPAAVEAYSGSDAVVGALHEQRVDQRAACLALAGRLDHLGELAHDAAAAAHTDQTSTQSRIDAVTDAVHAIPTPEPSAGDSGYDGPTTAHADELADELHTDVRGLQWLAWFLAGLVLVVIVRPSVSRWWGQ